MKLTHGVTMGLLALAAALAYPGSAAWLTAPQGAPVLAIEDVAVVDVREGRILANQTVLIEGRRVTRIGPASSTPIPVGARTLEGQGRYLSPGFADMHVHLVVEESLGLLLANGITHARDMFGSPWQLSLRDQIAEGLVVGPRLTVASPILEGTPPAEHADVILTEGRILLDDSATAADTVRSLVEQGYDAIKIYNNLNASAYAGITAEAWRMGVPVVGHLPIPVGLQGAFQARQSSIEHLRGYVLEAVSETAPDRPAADLRSRLVAWRHADTTRLRELAIQTAALGIWNVPTLSLMDQLVPADRIDELTSRPGWRRCMKGRFADPVATRERRPYFAVMTDADFRATQEGVAPRRHLVRMLREEGAGILVGTDRNPWGFAFHWEMQELVRAGLDPSTVLRAATLDAAIYLGEEDEFGSVEVGKRADLVLLEANPLEDIRNAARVGAVIVGGDVFDSQQLERMTADGCEVFGD